MRSCERRGAATRPAEYPMLIVVIAFSFTVDRTGFSHPVLDSRPGEPSHRMRSFVPNIASIIRICNPIFDAESDFLFDTLEQLFVLAPKTDTVSIVRDK
jgi:hypothetical protein